MVQVVEKSVQVWAVEFDRFSKNPLRKQVEEVADRYYGLPKEKRPYHVQVTGETMGADFLGECGVPSVVMDERGQIGRLVRHSRYIYRFGDTSGDR